VICNMRLGRINAVSDLQHEVGKNLRGK
jgi:hypothetical protein